MAAPVFRRAFSWLIFALCVLPAGAQAWERLSQPPQPGARDGAVLVYDRVHQHLVLFGGEGDQELADTWTLEGHVWTERAPETVPPARKNAHGFWDSAAERVVVFGGTSGSGLDRNEIWSWDGSDWSSTSPASLVSPERQNAAVACDNERDRIVLFGGEAGGVSMSDTWEYDGTGWIKIEPPTSPTARHDARMGYDPARKVVVLTGGFSETEDRFSDTWTYDGNTWTELSGAAAPASDSSQRMTWDPVEQKLMLAGEDETDHTLRAWHFDGAQWIARANTDLDAPSSATPSLAFDENRGYALYFTSETRENVGYAVTSAGDWSKLLPAPQPGGIGVDGGGFVYDGAAAELRMFGISDESREFEGWRLNDTMWRMLQMQNSVAVSSSSGFAYDAARGTTVAVGNCTAELSGDTWTQRTCDPNPPPQAAVAYDAGRSRVVAFGGFISVGSYSDRTWEWDGTEWHQIAAANTPPGRYDGAMAYDAARSRLVLFGGLGLVSGQLRYLQDTWELVGDSWQQVDTAGPSTTFRSTPTLTYNPDRQRIVMWAGQDVEDAMVWEFDGSTWTGSAAPPERGEEGLLGYDPQAKRLVLHLLDGTTWVRDSGSSPETDGGDDGGSSGDDQDETDGGAGTDESTDGNKTGNGCGCTVRVSRAPLMFWLFCFLLAARRACRSRRR